MKCYQIQKKMPAYLDDMLPETLRSEVRGHLSVCDVCRGHGLRLGSIAGDLKRLGNAEAPFNLTDEVLHRLSQKPEDQRLSVRGKYLPGILGSILVIGGIGAAIFYLKPVLAKLQKVVSTEPVSKTASPQDDILLEQLKQMDAGLSRVTANAGLADTPKKSDAFSVSSIDPLHWHFRFNNVSERNSFIEKIKKINKKFEFESEYFMALSINQDYVGDLRSVVDGFPAALADGPRMDLGKLPKVQAPIKATFLMEAKGSTITPLLWKLRFLRRDSYLLVQRLHEAEFEYLYEAPDLLVLRVPQGKYQQLQSEIKQMLGLEVVDGTVDAPFPDLSAQSIPIIILLDES